MKKTILSACILICHSISYAQASDPSAGNLTHVKASDPSINNLIHIQGYRTSEYGAIPPFIKVGKGHPSLILIPGLGFDGSVFSDFIEANKKNCTIYAITLPGMGSSSAAPMPGPGTSYDGQYWTKGIIEGLNKLIEKEKLDRPVLAGSFVLGTQLALRMAIDHPDKVRGVIVLGGPAKFVYIDKNGPRQLKLNEMVKAVDSYTAPIWFKKISKNAFDKGNYPPEIYSLDSAVGQQLWKQSAAVPLPVMIRYACEFFASDITLELSKIKCPVLVLRPTFNDKVLKAPANNYIKPQFIDTWNDAILKNTRIIIIDIENAASFVWKDQPDEVFSIIGNFLRNRWEDHRR